MEHESFENEQIAGLMNRLFVNIKVDREERPDVDEIYMNAVQMLTGRGGWPMTVFLTPDGSRSMGEHISRLRIAIIFLRFRESWRVSPKPIEKTRGCRKIDSRDSVPA